MLLGSSSVATEKIGPFVAAQSSIWLVVVKGGS
jgi:hypothetical protein